MNAPQNPYPQPGQAPYAQPGYPSQPEPRNGFGITALVLAIIGLVFGLVPLTGLIALILGALAVLFGLLGLGRVRRGRATNRGMSIVGTVLGVAALALGIWGMVVLFRATSELVDGLNESSRQLDAYTTCLEQAPTPEAAAQCSLPGGG
jgi:hypothetical protein